MSLLRRHTLSIVLLLVLVLAAGAGWSVHRLHVQSQAAERMVDQLAECRVLVHKIKALQNKPSMAAASAMPMTDLARLIEDAAKEAGLSLAKLIRISPNPAQRLGETPYQRKPTQVLLRGVSLEQAIRFLHAVQQHDRELHVTAVRLSAAREPARQTPGSEQWTLEATLSYLIYAPPNDSGRARSSALARQPEAQP